jgi:F-type H+-transporting ATPase subunit b
MKRNLSTFRGLLVCAALLGFSAVAIAADESVNPGEQSADSLVRWIHFVIVAALLFWLCKKVMPQYIRGNADRISSAITKATAIKAEADKQLKEAAAKLTRLEQEIEQFRQQALKDGAAELERLRGMTKVELEKVGAAAKVEIAAAEHAARVELKALAAKLAMDRAESMVSQQMTPAVQESMINNFVQSLQGRPN